MHQFMQLQFSSKIKFLPLFLKLDLIFSLFLRKQLKRETVNIALKWFS